MLKMTNFVSLSTARAALLELLRLKTKKAALVQEDVSKHLEMKYYFFHHLMTSCQHHVTR